MLMRLRPTYALIYLGLHSLVFLHAPTWLKCCVCSCFLAHTCAGIVAYYLLIAVTLSYTSTLYLAYGLAWCFFCWLLLQLCALYRLALAPYSQHKVVFLLLALYGLRMVSMIPINSALSLVGVTMLHAGNLYGLFVCSWLWLGGSRYFITVRKYFSTLKIMLV